MCRCTVRSTLVRHDTLFFVITVMSASLRCACCFCLKSCCCPCELPKSCGFSTANTCFAELSLRIDGIGTADKLHRNFYNLHAATPHRRLYPDQIRSASPLLRRYRRRRRPLRSRRRSQKPRMKTRNLHPLACCLRPPRRTTYPQHSGASPAPRS